jgi:hypothetical protein
MWGRVSGGKKHFWTTELEIYHENDGKIAECRKSLT